MEQKHYFTDPSKLSWADIKEVSSFIKTVPGFPRPVIYLVLFPVLIGLKIFGRPMYYGVYPFRCREGEVELDSLSANLQELLEPQEQLLLDQGFVLARRVLDNPKDQRIKVDRVRSLLVRGDVGVQIVAVEGHKQPSLIQSQSMAKIPPPKPQAQFLVESFFGDQRSFKTLTIPNCGQSRPPGDFVLLPNADIETLIKNHLERKAKKGGNAIWFETADAYMDAVDAEAERDLAWQIKKGVMIKATVKQLEKLRAAGRI